MKSWGFSPRVFLVCSVEHVRSPCWQMVTWLSGSIPSQSLHQIDLSSWVPTYISWFNLHNSSLQCAPLLFPFYRCRSWGLKKLNMIPSQIEIWGCLNLEPAHWPRYWLCPVQSLGIILYPVQSPGFFLHHQAILQHQLGVQQFISVLTLST